MSIEVSYEYNQSFPGDKIDSYENVSLIRTYPRSDDDVTDIQHLPNGVAEYPQNSRRVLRAKVPSSAAVELRRTVEAAADQFDVKGINLVNQVQEMINRGLITNQFSSALHHVRKIGNQGAHATDAKLTREEVELAGRFVELLLRNLFEVTGELKQIEGKNSDNNDIDTDVDTNTPS
ncbi:DUF4145 domain-containing protein [Actinopolyspora mortivallis]|uniref:DUF4145 domain-containing protein n=1 Tax=Actinopolyspora mortivallis TaxID=33906 RepID=UPI001B7FB7AB|nr:DUF4145 domain-containing protein [Actinopolyspora mortivallis]